MIKVPASREGLPAIRQLTSEGINVNITLLFGVDRYEEVARAYIDGLSAFVLRGGDPAHVSSVASFFVSRIDTMVDGLIAKRLAAATRSECPHDTGQSSRNSRDSQREARVPTLPDAVPDIGVAAARWLGSTPATSPVGEHQHKKSALPRRALRRGADRAAYGQHDYAGNAGGLPRSRGLRASLEDHVDEARETIEALTRAGISLSNVTDRLLEDGVTLFSEAFRRYWQPLIEDDAARWRTCRHEDAFVAADIRTDNTSRSLEVSPTAGRDFHAAGSFPDLRDAFNADDLPIAFILRRDDIRPFATAVQASKADFCARKWHGRSAVKTEGRTTSRRWAKAASE